MVRQKVWITLSGCMLKAVCLGLLLFCWAPVARAQIGYSIRQGFGRGVEAGGVRIDCCTDDEANRRYFLSVMGGGFDWEQVHGHTQFGPQAYLRWLRVLIDFQWSCLAAR